MPRLMWTPANVKAAALEGEKQRLRDVEEKGDSVRHPFRNALIGARVDCADYRRGRGIRDALRGRVHQMPVKSEFSWTFPPVGQRDDPPPYLCLPRGHAVALITVICVRARRIIAAILLPDDAKGKNKRQPHIVTHRWRTSAAVSRCCLRLAQ